MGDGHLVDTVMSRCDSLRAGRLNYDEFSQQLRNYLAAKTRAPHDAAADTVQRVRFEMNHNPSRDDDGWAAAVASPDGRVTAAAVPADGWELPGVGCNPNGWGAPPPDDGLGPPPSRRLSVKDKRNRLATPPNKRGDNWSGSAEAPQGWRTMATDIGRTYYLNTLTGETQWALPTQAATPVIAAGAQCICERVYSQSFGMYNQLLRVFNDCAACRRDPSVCRIDYCNNFS